MRKQISLLLYAGTTPLLLSQVGIGTEIPQSTLEIVTQSSTSSTNALEINNSANAPVSILKDNGNFIFNGALMPDGDPGEKGSYLISEGSGAAPIWKKLEGAEGAKVITQVFNARRGSISSTRNNANSEYRINFPTVYLNAPTVIGSWNSSNNEFTVSKSGLYHITAGFTAGNIAYDPYLENNAGMMRINTTNYKQSIKGQIIQMSATILTFNFSGEVVLPLNAGDKIWVSSTITKNWYQDLSFFHIKYSEL